MGPPHGRARGRSAPHQRHPRGSGPPALLRVALVLVGFAVWLALPVAPLTITFASAPLPAGQPGLPWLATNAGRIVDPQGRSVLLRGFNDNALLEPNAHPAPLDATDASIMQAAGFDVVRLPIAWSLLEPEQGHFDAAYLDRIAAAVALLNAHGLYVVLDMHSLGWSPAFGGSGAPAWATVAGIPDPEWGPMPSIGRLASPAINVATANFWLTDGWQSEYRATWQWIAQRFRDDSGVAGYDVINEPHSFPLLPIRFDKDQLWPFYARTVAAIGSVDPNHLFFLDNDMAADLPTTVVPLAAPNLVYAPHVYTGALIPPDFNGDAHPLAVHVDELAREATQVPAAVWFGEFSIDSERANGPGWITAILDSFDAHSAGWAWWQWRESSGYGVRSADGSTVDNRLLSLLARPYVAATPSGVTAATSGSGHAVLQLIVAAAHGAAAIDVAWPGYTLGAPEVASTCGAQSAWTAGSGRLGIVVPADAACSISVTRLQGSGGP
jgi:endoglycosylceramidase